MHQIQFRLQIPCTGGVYSALTDLLAQFKGALRGREGKGKGKGKGGERVREGGEGRGRGKGEKGREGRVKGKGDTGNGRDGRGYGMGRGGKGRKGGRGKEGEGLQPPNFNSWPSTGDAARKRSTIRRPVSVCPSVCPSHSYIVSKQLKMSSNLLLGLIAPSF